MELFLPSLIIILLVAFFIFMVLPRIGPMILAVVALVALIAAGFHHYSLFASEYTLSTWQYGLAAYTPWIVLGFAFVFIISAVMFIMGGPEAKAAMLNSVSTPMETIQESIANSTANMPSAASATNVVTATLNRAINSVPGNSAPANAAPNANRANANRNKKTPNIPGLGFAASQV
jgi:ABC-type transport system involved in multi-copper enzyme maturation permease subunit